ncbi:zinc finger protein 62 homolog [Sitodiplosis mosellana]|uniref:zinc finger protein 62 homolog n=1 Tax=Sitodiplosis mosellana TaxID=263140 RepID=UPI002444552B|nr:zinc finger protein 62 homolog [Sitodiplosis mosellana]
MSGTVAVHQCLFCPQTFGSAIEKDDHILEHFAQETCTDCDQSLIRIGSNLYTLHNAVTCIKRESKLDVSIQHDSHKRSINQNYDDGDYNEIVAPSNTDYGQQLNIKLEPETEHNEQLISVDPMNFADVSYNENYQGSNNQYRDEDNSGVGVTPSNTVPVQHEEIKMEPGAQDEQFISVYVNDFTVTSGMDSGPGQVFHSQPLSTAIERISEANSKSNNDYKCDICGKIFQRSSQLGQHKKYTHRAFGTVFGRFECVICMIVFQRKDYLRKHIRLKHDPNCLKFKCVLCYRTFLSQKSLDNHLPKCEQTKKTELSQRSKKRADQRTDCDRMYCEICKRVFNSKITLRQHMRLKHDPCTKFKCVFCWTVFLSKKSLDNHHLFRCKRYKKSLIESPGNDIASTEKTPIDDGNMKSNEKDKYCEICDKTFCNKSTAERHTFLVHKIGGHHCIDCKQVFHTAIGLLNHGPKCEKLLQQTFECHICHKISKSKRNLRFHLQSIHVKRRKIKCEKCDRHFSCKSAYESHKNRIHLKMNIHNFVCSTCGRAFTTKTRLVQHEYIHTGERPLKCTHVGCEQTFRTSSAKYAHLRIHRGQKKFKCRIDGCDQKFGGVIGYKKHKLNVHGIPMTK